ncbi:hypothetical protein M419DRAFT_6738 [Trichoderma reesei RUT C-30]|uniref:BHLH domain-containing protein n=1 Tax=Hypocrea jecorina (strain ATCC 56765 / BCRC 32924 / NRRL 11460 / Rut C-30) TaxID=1344414 RepID=A0A024SGG3_HYPJR|nr:hypothetical protein M419DRAFT_6738 [Trichoderma reesei RUT C-30]
MADRANSTATPPSPDRNKKKRIRNWTADDRAAHRVFERSRREAFKERLTLLAGLIPSLRSTDPNRLSKHVVIDQSVALHKAEQQQIAESLDKINQLVAERDQLLHELNTWRLNAGLDARQPRVTEDDSEATTLPVLDEASASILGAGVSSVDASNEHQAAGSGQMFLEEPSSYVTTEQPSLPVEPPIAPIAEPTVASTSLSLDIPWMSNEMDFNMPNSLALTTEYNASAPPKSPAYTHLPMQYDMVPSNLDDDTLRFNTTVMHVTDPSTFHNSNSYIFTG